MIKKLTDLFPFWALLFSAIAYLQPNLFSSLKNMIIPLLGIVMFGMGITLTVNDFKSILKKPKTIALGVSLQYLMMPALAWMIAFMLQLPKELMAGMIIVGCCPGGTASNVICYLAKANVALSITLTLVSTLVSFFMTPLLTKIYLGKMIYVPALSMLFSILKIVIVPVLLGILINTFLRARLNKIRSIFPLLSVMAIVFIIAIIVGLNHNTIKEAGFVVLLAVMIHNFFGIISGYVSAKILNLNESDSRTIAIEVGMQNSGLGVALALKYFSSLTALPGAIFSVWHNLSGSFLARIWSKQTND